MHAAPSLGDSPHRVARRAVRQIRARLDARADGSTAHSPTSPRVYELPNEKVTRTGEADLARFWRRPPSMSRARAGASFYQAALPLLVSANDVRAEGAAWRPRRAWSRRRRLSAVAAWYRRAIALRGRRRRKAARQLHGQSGHARARVRRMARTPRASTRARDLLESVGDARRLAITLGISGAPARLGSLVARSRSASEASPLIEGSGDERLESSLLAGSLPPGVAWPNDDAEAMITQGERLALASDSLVVPRRGIAKGSAQAGARRKTRVRRELPWNGCGGPALASAPGRPVG